MSPESPLLPGSPLSPCEPLSPVTPLSPVAPLSPCEPLSPAAPCCPSGPDCPLSPGAPLTPVGPGEPEFEVDLEKRLVFVGSVITSFFSFLTVLFFSSEVFLNLTSKIEYNEENKSFTITQIVSTSLIDEGKGFLESPIISEKIPSLTLR